MYTEYDKSIFIDQCNLFFAYLIREKEWSGLQMNDYVKWNNNFSSIEDGRYISARILNHMLYYSEDDLIKLLDDAIQSIFDKEIILQKQLSTGFSCLSSVLEYEIKNSLSSTIIVPILEDMQDPGASGPEIIRYIRNHMNYSFQTSFHFNLVENTQYKRIIMVDDCIGSGEQCRSFWETAQISTGKLLKDWVAENRIKPFIVTLVGYKETILKLQYEYPDLNFVCAEMVDDTHQIFSACSRCWKDSIEQNTVDSILTKKLKEIGIARRGYADLSFAIVLHKTIPDWSLPLLFKNKSDWNHLIERKDTYV